MKSLSIGNHIPFYIKVSILLIGLIAFFYSIYIAQDIILPFVFSVLMALLLNPVVNYLVKRKFNRILAISITLVVTFIFVAGLIFLIISQFNTFLNDLPNLRVKVDTFFKDAITWLVERFNMSAEKINAWIAREKTEGLKNSNVLIGNAALTVSRFFMLIALIPVYIFLLLFYKPLILKFFSKLFPSQLHNTVVEVMGEIKVLVQHYLLGLLIEMAVMTILTAVGLAIIGIQSPIVFGLITALLNVIPYVGVLIANITFVLIALITKSPTSALLVFILYVVIQVIDNNIVVPKIIGSKVKINALAIIITVLIGGALCGVTGMFLAIPLIAVFKVICDHIKSLQPLGYLLGDSMPGSGINFFKTTKPEPEIDEVDKSNR